MGESVIPLADLRYAAAVPAIPVRLQEPTGRLSDRLGRAMRDLRISVTDRCNFRCGYCMPKAVFDRDYQFLPQHSLLQLRGDHTPGTGLRCTWREQAAVDRRLSRCCAGISKSWSRC